MKGGAWDAEPGAEEDEARREKWRALQKTHLLEVSTEISSFTPHKVLWESETTVDIPAVRRDIENAFALATEKKSNGQAPGEVARKKLLGSETVTLKGSGRENPASVRRREVIYFALPRRDFIPLFYRVSEIFRTFFKIPL